MWRVCVSLCVSVSQPACMYLCAGVYLCVRSYPGLTETQLDVAHALVPNLNAEMSNFCVCM